MPITVISTATTAQVLIGASFTNVIVTGTGSILTSGSSTISSFAGSDFNATINGTVEAYWTSTVP